MNLEFKSMKSTVLALGALASLALAHPAKAQLNISVASIEGGSSALLGNFAPGASFREGALPKAIGLITTNISNYKQSGDTGENVFVATAVTATDGTVTDSAVNTEIRYNYYGNDPNTITIIVLLRSDSGFGVRYIANRMYISDWGSTFQYPDGKDITDTTSAYYDANAAAVKNYLVTNQGTGEPIDTGFADVTADSIVRYHSFDGIGGISVSGLSSTTSPIIRRQLAVQTLLLVHSKDLISGSQLNFARSDVQNLVNGGTYPFGITEVNYREPQSGTRHTELLDLMEQFDTMGNPQTVVDGSYSRDDVLFEAGGTVRSGTGAMLSAVNTDATSFGYAFVTGNAGDGRANVRVGQYGGVNPYDDSTGTGELSIPNNNSQTAYSTTAYYTHTADGTYKLWNIANEYVLPGDNAASADVAAALLASAGLVHLEGLLELSDLGTNAQRDSFTSDIVVIDDGTGTSTGVGEEVTDGQKVSGSPTSGLTFPGNPQP